MKKLKRKFMGHPLRTMPDPMPQPNAFEDQKTAYFVAGPFGIIYSDNDRYDDEKERWRHVSISHRDRIPHYFELKACRQVFFPP